MAPAKRASTTLVSSSAAKRKKCRDVESAVAEAGGYSAAVKRLLEGAVADSLGTYKEDRHPYQKTLVGMIGDVLASSEQDYQMAIESADAKLGEIRTSHETLTKELDALASEWNATVDAEKAAKDAFVESETALTELEEAVKEKASFDAGAVQFEELKEKPTKHAKDIVKLGKGFQFDETLLKGLASALKKMPDVRSTFEVYAMGQLGESLGQKVSELSKLDLSEDVVTAARAKKDGLKIALEEAKQAQQKAKDAQAKAQKAVAAAMPNIKKAELNLADAQKNLEDFRARPMAAFKDLVELRPAEIDHAETVSSAFVFIKPHAVTDGVKKLVRGRFASEGIRILSEGRIRAEKIDKESLIDTHYGAIAARAMKQTPADLVVPKKAQDDFAKAFGLTWDDALKGGLVYNLKESAEKLGATYDEIGSKFDQLEKGVTMLKFGGGFYCGKVDDIYIINGFYARMRSQFTVKGECIYYYEIEWDTSRMSWSHFRGNLLGATDPKSASQGSLRNEVFATWSDLGLASEPNTGNNGLHASASPFEALAERANWLGVPLSQDHFGRAMMAVGVPEETIKAWCDDPAVNFENKRQSLFDLLEDLDGGDILKKSLAIVAAN